MSNEIERALPSEGEPRNASTPVSPELVQMLGTIAGTSDGGGSALRTLLKGAKLSQEQEAMVDLLISAQAETDEADSPITALASAHDPTGEEREELADLRSGNDALAAALGACRFCWGGEPECEVCAGYGYAGHFQPDPELFDELVLPAVRRVTAHRRRAGRAGSALYER